MKLSVCIPTHHGRRDDLAAALARLIAQIAALTAPSDVEICITDNASDDGTEAMVAEHLAAGAPVRYARHATDLGAAGNVMASVALATGTWCWLHSSDDLLADGAVATVIAALDAHPDVAGLTMARAVFDLAMTGEHGTDPLAVLPTTPHRSRVIDDPRAAIAELGLMHTFLPSQVVRREAWEAVVAADPERPLRASRFYPHVHVITRILLGTPRPWIWVADKLVLMRPRHDVAPAGGALAAACVQPVDLVRTWTAALGRRRRPLAGRDGALHRALLARAAGVWAVPAELDRFKAQAGHTTRDDLRLLASLLAAFWSLPAFWRTGLPRLLRSHRRVALPVPAREDPGPFTSADLAVAVATTAAVPERPGPACNLVVACTIVNRTRRTLTSAGPEPLHLAARWVDAGGRPVREHDRRPLPRSLGPGERCALSIVVPTPWAPGRYTLDVSAVQEHVAWCVDVDPALGVSTLVDVAAGPPGRDAAGSLGEMAGPFSSDTRHVTDAFLAQWSAPAPAGARHGINRFLHHLWELRADLQASFPDLDGEGGAGLVRWVYTSGRFETAFPDALLPPCPEDLEGDVFGPAHDDDAGTAASGVNVIGYLGGELGIGAAARLAIDGLDAAGVPVLPVDAGLRDSARDGVAFGTVPPQAAGLRATLACVSPEMLGVLRRDHRREIAALVPTKATVAFVWWEVEERIPFRWHVEDTSWLHEVWVGSEHVRRCLEPFVTVPIVNVGVPIDPDPPAFDMKPRLGLDGRFCFLTAFDYASDLRRKNPLGAIQAFAAAFAPGDGCALVVKCASAAAHPEAHGRVLRAAAAHPDVHVVDHMLPEAEYNALLGSCDCYLSLHRAEGFGLPLATAMHHARPVIATAYSGNLDFMTESNSFLVPATRTSVGESDRYPVDGVWAEPDLPAAIDALRAVAGDPGAAAAKARRAAADIRRAHAPAVVGARMAERLRGMRLATAIRATGDAAKAVLADAPALPPGDEPALAALRAHADHQRRMALALLGAIAQTDARAAADAEGAIRAGALAHAATLARQRAQARARHRPATIGDPGRRGPAAGGAPRDPDPGGARAGGSLTGSGRSAGGREPLCPG